MVSQEDNNDAQVIDAPIEGHRFGDQLQLDTTNSKL